MEHKPRHAHTDDHVSSGIVHKAPLDNSHLTNAVGVAQPRGPPLDNGLAHTYIRPVDEVITYVMVSQHRDRLLCRVSAQGPEVVRVNHFLR